jgi:uncharacterized membrane protein
MYWIISLLKKTSKVLHEILKWKSSMIKKAPGILMAILSIIIGLYPVMYFSQGIKYGLLNSKPNELLTSNLWNIGFYTHISFGGLALLIGWTQFSSVIRNKHLSLHKQIGKLYIIAVIFSSIAGIYIAFFATGGLLSSMGFICLGFIWFSTTIIAYVNIRKGQIEKHQKMMIYSYAACFAAVTLRIWLPLLTMIFRDFIIAYTIVAWLCWIPNLFVAILITRRLETHKLPLKHHI